MINYLSPADVERMVQMLGAASDPLCKLPLVERKLKLAGELVALVEADLFLWNTVKFDPATTSVSPLCVLDGGFRDEAQKVSMYRFLLEPSTASILNQQALQLWQRGKPSTIDAFDHLSADVRETIQRAYESAGLAHCILSIYPVGPNVGTGLGIHRFRGRPPYTEREIAIVHTIATQVDWLHRHATDVPAGDKALELSPRERQVLVFLLGGDSREQIAAKFGLSKHTVGDYVKSIFKRMGVRSEGELLAKFISGGLD